MNKKEVKKAPILRFKGFTNDWEQQSLKKIFTTITDYVANGSFASLRHNVKTYKNPNYAYLIRLMDASNNWNGPWLFTDKKGYDFLSKSSLKPKDILLSNVGAGVGKTFQVPKLDKPMTLAPNAVLLRSNKLNNQFCFYLLKYPQNKNKVLSLVGVSAQPKLNKTDFGRLIFNIPSDRSEQDKISKILSKLDKIVNLQQRKLELLSLIKKTIIKHLFKLKNSDSLNLKFKTSCSQWNSKKLGEIAKFINGRAFKQSELLNKGKYPVLRVGNFYTNDKWFYSDLNLNKNKYADKGDLLYTWSATFGPHIWKGPKVIFHYHIWKIDFDPSTVNKTFLFYFLEADKENLLTNSNGSTMIHITKSNMENKIINLPQFSIQQNIGTFLSNLDYLINQEKIKSKQLIQLKRFLLQNMFI